MNGLTPIPTGTSHYCVRRSDATGELEYFFREGPLSGCHHCLPVLRPEILVPSYIAATKMMCRSSMADRVVKK